MCRASSRIHGTMSAVCLSMAYKQVGISTWTGLSVTYALNERLVATQPCYGEGACSQCGQNVPRQGQVRSFFRHFF